MSVWKILQRQFYDILSNKCYLILLLLLTYTSFISVLHFCEVWLSGNRSSKSKAMEGFIDNISGKPLQSQLCQYFPIDVVYTWVNGSDPAFISQLKLNERRLRKEMSETCVLPDCHPSHFTAFKMNISDLHQVLNELSYVSLKSIKATDNNWTILRWDSVKSAEEQADKVFNVNQETTSPFHVHWTTDDGASNLYVPGNTIAIKAVNKSLTSVTREILELNLGQVIASLWRYPEVLYAELNSHSEVQQILKGKKWNIIFIKHLLKLNVTRAGLVFEIPSKITPDDYAASRYEDKEELRYSLRSLEKYAPWVRKVYIVTNGQLPHWLDMSNPRVRIITHESIFLNSSHLPTFSSPAIETHLHRIPGLSEKFLYFNDDIFLGEEVLPEDFITSRGGQKVYLSWPVPDCSAVCPWTWVGDGTCDTPCNTTTCDFDGQDCLSSKSSNPHQHQSQEDYTDYAVDFLDKSSKSKNNKTFQLSEDYDESGVKNALRNTGKPDSSKNNSYVINNDDDLNDLIEVLFANRSTFTSDVIQDMFLLLKTLNFSYSLPEQFEGGNILEKLIGSMNDTSLINSILLQKLGENYRNVMYESFYKTTKSSKHKRRNILNVKNIHPNVILLNKSTSQSEPKNSNSTTSRLISPLNLSRTQVGVPPIGVAESFYAFQPETTSLQRTLDTFAESLLHVNSLLNKRYGYKARKVPSHMPHLIDKNVMTSLQNEFPDEYAQTSSHYFRHPQDMQFSFGYFYYLMNEEVDIPVSELFDMFDTDESGTWSDREIRTVLTRLYDLPLQRSSVLNFETSLLYCAQQQAADSSPPPGFTTPPFERYIDSKLPLVTKHLVENCRLICDLLKRKMGRKKRFLYTSVKPVTREAVVGFHMITSNLSYLLSTLDKIRRKPKKFICLNDNMDATREEDNQLIRAVLIDFFHSLFPKPSQFELPADYRNRYLYYSDFINWQAKKRKISIIMYATLIVAVTLIFYCLFYAECQRLHHKTKRKFQKVFPGLRSTRRKIRAKL